MGGFNSCNFWRAVWVALHRTLSVFLYFIYKSATAGCKPRMKKEEGETTQILLEITQKVSL